MTEQSTDRDVLHKLAENYLKDQQSNRRWTVLKRIFFACLFAIIIITSFSKRSLPPAGPHVGLIDIKGMIAANTRARADYVATGLKRAYKKSDLKGILLRINSPGGSPVQASYIFQEIKRQRAKHPKIPIYAVCTDVCASAAYYIAAGADKVYADPASLVGSIGVIYNGFGFTGTLDKLGVERRLMTAGKHKGMLDPFSPSDPAAQTYMQAMLDALHQEFIASVKAGRGDRLSNDPQLFSGRFWNGRKAQSLGLVDAFGSPGYVAREVFKQERVVNYTFKDNPWEKLAKQVGAASMTWLRTQVLGAIAPSLR